MKRAIRERLQRILDSSTSETDSSNADRSFSCPLGTLNSPRIKSFETYKQDLHDRSSSASSLEAGSTSQVEESQLNWQRRDGYLERMVLNILTDSSSFSEEEGSLNGEETYIPQWLRQRSKSASKDKEKSFYKDVKNATSSGLLSVSEELQTLSKKLKKGAGSDRSSSSNVSVSRKENFKRKHCTTIYDCKKRLEYLISKLEGLDGEARLLRDSAIDDEVVLGDTKSDETVEATAFGSLVRTEVVAGKIGGNKDTLSGKNGMEIEDPRQQITYRRSPVSEAVVESVIRPQLPAEDIESIPLKAKNRKSFEVKPRNKSRSRTRRRKSKKSSTKRRTFKEMVEVKVLPRVRVAKAMAEIPKAKLTKPMILARKIPSNDDQRNVNSNKDESAIPPSSTPNKATEEITISKEEPMDTALTSPDMAKFVNSKADVMMTELENKGSRNEGKDPNESIRLERDADPSFPRTHSRRKPTSDVVEMHSTNRPVARHTRTASFRTLSMEKSSTKLQSRSNEAKRKKTQSKRTPLRDNNSARSKRKMKETQCLDLLLSDNDAQEQEPKSAASTSAEPSSTKTSKPTLTDAETTSKEPDLSDKTEVKKSPRRLSSMFRLALGRNDSMDTGDMFRKRNSIGKERTARLKESRLGETWRKTKIAFDSVWEKNFNQTHSASGLLSFFFFPKTTKSQRPSRFTV